MEAGEALFDCLRYGDIDGSNSISYEEFLACAIDFNIFVNDGYLRLAFSYFDKDNSGHLDKYEM